MIMIAIIGYGNLGQGVEKVASFNKDMKVVGVFTRRNPEEVTTLGSNVYSLDDLYDYKDKIDVCILCGGSAHDLPKQTPEITKHFNTVDSFDNHGSIPEHYQRVNEVAKTNDTVSIISAGWDPGLFSLNRLLGESILPQGETHTFWGKGVSQGHSDAIRRIEGVVAAVQYTIPNEDIIERILKGEKIDPTLRQKHTRLCYVVLDDGAPEDIIHGKIVTMPDYFSDYDTTVNFISQEEFAENHTGMPHGGTVIRIGSTNDGVKQVYEFNLKLDSNPEFTASVNLAFARACHRLAKEGGKGAFTVLDIPPKYLSSKLDIQLQKELL